MSTSIAVLPAYRTAKASRTEARASRTIFGTTLDNSTIAHAIFQNKEANSSAEHLHKKRYNKWHSPSPSKQALLDAAWGIKDYSQAEIGEEQNRGYSRLSSSTSANNYPSTPGLSVSTASEKETGIQERKSSTPIIAYKDRFGVYNVGKKFGGSDRVSRSINTKAHSPRQLGKPRTVKKNKQSAKMSHTPRPRNSKYQQTSQQKGMHTVQVPRFPLPPGQRNYLRTASLKITETGAKDLINARPINKIGLGETKQYNHESFKKRETPNQYVDNGNVFSLGQKGRSITTNSEVSGPGGFYKIDRAILHDSTAKGTKSDDECKYSVPYEPSLNYKQTANGSACNRNASADTLPARKTSPAPNTFEDAVPLNILHKYGASEVRNLLSGRESEIEGALNKATDSRLSHSGMVPARTNVPELNHPVNPPPSYYSNFGQSLKYDKFEGGLHLYIK